MLKRALVFTLILLSFQMLSGPRVMSGQSGCWVCVAGDGGDAVCKPFMWGETECREGVGSLHGYCIFQGESGCDACPFFPYCGGYETFAPVNGNVQIVQLVSGDIRLGSGHVAERSCGGFIVRVLYSPEEKAKVFKESMTIKIG